MAKSIYRINAMVAVSDPSRDLPEVRDSKGNVKRPPTKGIRMVPAGEPVELDDKEGKLHMDRHGGTVEEKPASKAKAKVDTDNN